MSSHGFSVQSDLISVVHNPVENSIGERSFGDGRVPLLLRDLAGDDGESALVSVVNDFP
jgi:hypothetical protein